MPSDQSAKLFGNNFKIFWFFGIWGGRKPSKCYKYYSVLYIFVTFICYNILLTLNLIYIPRKIEIMLREVIFNFTEITVAAKIFMIILMRDKIIEVLDMIDCDEFLGDYKDKAGILPKIHTKYKFYWKWYTIMGNVTYSSQVFVPIFLNLIRGIESELPICKYYFLSDETRQSYFVFWFIYQSFGIYGHMMYNINIDSFIVGLLLIALAQLRILNTKLCNFKLSEQESKLSNEEQDRIAIITLNGYLRHYDTILKFCSTIQDVMSTKIFVQFGVASIIICLVMSGFVLPSSTETKVFLVMYFFNMTLQIFIPGFLGTQLTYESQDLMFAAYNADWIPRSESFKRSLKLLIHRATTPIQLSGLKMFTLSLVTFTSIMKTAYSFFTLIRNFQEQ